MNVHIFKTSEEANARAAEMLIAWMTSSGFKNLMVAAGNTPLEMYAKVAQAKPMLPSLEIFALDEYVGVPLEEPRNCANLMRRSVAEAWGIPDERFYTVSSLEAEALKSVRRHEELIEARGGLDGIVLGLGQNGHLGFNEPGSEPDSVGRLLDLQPISVEANRKWFGGKYAPDKGVTVGLKSILAARRVMILAYGPHKTAAVKAMVEGKSGVECPASFLQAHSETHAFLDEAAAAGLSRK